MNCDMTNGEADPTPLLDMGLLRHSSGPKCDPCLLSSDEPVIKVEKNEEIILCKKVRQAQQAKQMISAQTNHNNNVSDNVGNDVKIFNPPDSSRKRLMSEQIQGRLKRLRQIQLHHEHEVGDNENDENDFPLPRERLISICNMDKNALDDYLNGEQNQDPDAELLQYFPEEDQQKTYDPNKTSNSKSAPFLENYELYSDDNNEQISQLRTILEQNISGANQAEVSKKLTNAAENLSQVNLPLGSAAASLAMLNQRHMNVKNDTKRLSTAARKLNIDIPYNISSNSSLQIRKNYNFVPISSDQHSPRVGAAKAQSVAGRKYDTSTATSGGGGSFVSPRNTPIHGKQTSKASAGQNGYPAYVKPELPASAPPSPLLVQNYR
jgi:hypothetical protein